MKSFFLTSLFIFSLLWTHALACSVVYYVDKNTGTIYVANNEDYWYDVKAYIQIKPKTNTQYARLWYGWDNFAQGGVNEAGLFFDGAVTPEDRIPEGFEKPSGNLGDEILANCRTVEEALEFLKKKNVALTNAHMMFGDSTGNAVVVEWVEGERKLNWIKDNKLIMTNFLLSDTSKGNYPCYRYNNIEDAIEALQQSPEAATLPKVGSALLKGAQPPATDENGKTGGTLYSSFIDITNMQFVLVYKLDNSKVIKMDLKKEFSTKTKTKIFLK